MKGSKMTKIRTRKRSGIAVLAVLTVGLAGCSEWLLATHAVTGLAGWLASTTRTTAQTSEYTCYRNGEPIDCASLPEDVLPAAQ
jgi:hypothetical protein